MLNLMYLILVEVVRGFCGVQCLLYRILVYKGNTEAVPDMMLAKARGSFNMQIPVPGRRIVCN